MRLLALVLLIASSLLAIAQGSHPGGATGTAFRGHERKLKELFQTHHPCPVNGKKVGNCPGYEVGSVKHPRNGGAVSQDNMRWMTTDEYETTHQESSPES